MALCGTIWVNGGYVSNKQPAPSNYKNSIHRVQLGQLVRKSIGKLITFRVRRGNGHQGSVAGKLYQDKYPYFVPTSINNTEGQPARDALSTAVHNWQSVLTDEQKASYHKRAQNGLRMSGYNVYIRDYILANT